MDVLKESRPAKTEEDSPHPNQTDQRMEAKDMQRLCMWRLQSLERMAEAYGAETGSDRYMDIMAYRALTALLDGRIGPG